MTVVHLDTRWLRHPRRVLLCATLLATLGGCVSVPLPNLTTPLPAHWRNQATSSAGSKPDLQSWWHGFHDPRLDALVSQSLHANLDVAQAVQHLLATQALYRRAHAPFRPSLEFRTYHPVDPNADAAYFVIGFQSLWQLGLFGQHRGSLREAQSSVDTANARLRAARVAVVANVVGDWIDLCAAQQSIQTLIRIRQSRQRIAQLTATRVQLRLADAATLAMARAAAASASAALGNPRQRANAAVQHLALLLGRNEPVPAWLQAHRLPQLRGQSLTVIPATLLSTRPQIALARAAVLHEAGALGMARANTRPDIGLGGDIVWSVHTLAHRGEPSNAILSLGPTIDIPLFDWGLRKARANAQDHQLKASVLAYRQAVLEGVSDVETALGALVQQRRREIASVAAWQALSQSADREATRQHLGLADGIASANSGIARDEAWLEVIKARAARDKAYVALYAALGGAPGPHAASVAATSAHGDARR